MSFSIDSVQGDSLKVIYSFNIWAYILSYELTWNHTTE